MGACVKHLRFLLWALWKCCHGLFGNLTVHVMATSIWCSSTGFFLLFLQDGFYNMNSHLSRLKRWLQSLQPHKYIIVIITNRSVCTHKLCFFPFFLFLSLFLTFSSSSLYVISTWMIDTVPAFISSLGSAGMASRQGQTVPRGRTLLFLCLSTPLKLGQLNQIVSRLKCDSSFRQAPSKCPTPARWMGKVGYVHRESSYHVGEGKWL